MKKIITIKDVVKYKEGFNEKTKRPWVLYLVQSTQGDVFYTFSSAYINKIGETLQVDIQERNGRFMIVDRSKAERRHEQLMDALRHLYRKLTEIEIKLNSLIENYDNETRIPKKD